MIPVHTLELDDENMRHLVSILKAQIDTRKLLVKFASVEIVKTNHNKNLEILGAATCILESVMVQTGIK